MRDKPKKKPAQNQQLSFSSTFCFLKASLSTSHGCGQGDVVVLVRFDANLLLCEVKQGSG